jgi:hypothetical protein
MTVTQKPRDQYGRFISSSLENGQNRLMSVQVVQQPEQQKKSSEESNLPFKHLEIPLQNNCILYERDYIEAEVNRIVKNFSNIINFQYEFELYKFHDKEVSLAHSFKNFYIERGLRLYFFKYLSTSFKDKVQPILYNKYRFTVLEKSLLVDYIKEKDFSKEEIFFTVILADHFSFFLTDLRTQTRFKFGVSTLASIKKSAELFDSSMLEQIDRVFSNFKDSDLIVIRLPFCEVAGYPGDLAYDGHIQNFWFRPITLENYLHSVFLQKQIYNGVAPNNVISSSNQREEMLKKRALLIENSREEFNSNLAQLLKF